MTQEFTPKVWLLQQVSSTTDRSAFCGVFISLEAAQQHVRENLHMQYSSMFKNNFDKWDCINPTWYESSIDYDLKFTLELVPLGGVPSSLINKLAWRILGGNPMANDAAQDVLARGG